MADDAFEISIKAPGGPLSRRGFGALTLGAGVAAAGQALADDAVIETDVEVKTPDGTCDAAFFQPAGKGPWPGAVIFTDIGGLRPVFRDMGRRLASNGYAVLVPNPFYRSQKAPVIDGPLNFNDPAARARLFAFTTPLTDDAKARDCGAYIAFLDSQKVVTRKKPIGVNGYCLGGPYTLVAASVAPHRVGAGVSCHGGGLVTGKDDSPDLLIAKIKAPFYFAVAQNDDKRQPDAKDKLKADFAATGVPAGVEVYPADHGWCVKDNATYDAASAERAWTNLVSLFGRALA